MTPAASAAATTSASRTEPPGWTTARTPDATIQRLNQALGEVLQEKPVQQLMHDWVLEPQHSQPHELEQLRQADIAKWRPILAASGFVAD